ncbi:MAG TPA: heme-binding protein [Steroidobacteraceae bacterium]|nr:heme-binding protein [Steroidobacteraceae bacterium]
MTAFNGASIACGAVATVLLGAGLAFAQRQAPPPAPPAGPLRSPPPRPAKVPRPTLNEALKGLDAAVADANRAGISLSCAVLDVHGDLVAFVRMDDAGFLTASLAEGKALVSALFGRASGDLGAMAASPFFSSVNASVQNRMVPAQGAVPIVRDGRLVGAVGCSGGAPSQDEAAAKAAQARF